jgi:uncharacterized membrane protein
MQTPVRLPVASANEGSTTRLEAFSDGVFAIAITLLVLEIRLPDEPRSRRSAALGAALGALWPSYAGYAISFVTIGIMWANHHDVDPAHRPAWTTG